jgi:hypothetical protein
MTILRNKNGGQIQMKMTLNLYIQYIHIVSSKYLSSVLNLLKTTIYMVSQRDRCGGQIGGQIAKKTAIQRNLTHLNVIEGDSWCPC